MSTTATDFDRDTMAAWYANRHLVLGFGVERIFYMPTNAAPREIRFLEVNSRVTETTPLEPLDFGVAIDGPNAHQLIVTDVTPAQWDLIQRGRLPLPDDWTLEGSRELGRIAGSSLDDL